MNASIVLALALLMAVSFHLQFGQGGMVGFAHAVFAGAGAFATAHAWRWAPGVPVEALPLLGALTGAGLAWLLGGVMAGLSGTAFAMVTLGLGEMAWSVALAWPVVFGGEAGWSVNRDDLPSWLWGSVGGAWPFLAWAWTLVGLCLMVVWTRTPWGRWVVACRDNEVRARALGVQPAPMRRWAMGVSGAGAGLAGALAALHFEWVGVEALHPLKSATVLMFAVMAGGRHWGGAVLAGCLAWAVGFSSRLCCFSLASRPRWRWRRGPITLWPPRCLVFWRSSSARRWMCRWGGCC